MGETEKAMSGVDLAYQILKERKTDVYFRDLLTEVLTAKMVPSYLMMQSMAELHTQINMDSRFAFKGQGRWGLTGMGAVVAHPRPSRRIRRRGA